ncbi:RadC family protein [Kordiimonas marina]|uniref:RadC family protein n=1 Tax=Kordiimonas marina TaxID=2872312 RepID=UPI001FF50781|nr:DNA repair protein RadC [Kordiimonas marina]MCJ9430158.1 DNA repair protein RadC [Kordiimonas marina]
MGDADKDLVKGHRSRLRERFLKGGAEALADYELLELILCLAIPRRDVKPLAKGLIRQFGSYAAVLSAEPRDLGAFPGLGDTAVVAIKSVQASALHLARAEVHDRPVLSNWAAVTAYLQGVMANRSREQVRLMFLDRKNALVADEVLSDGTIDQAPVYPREVVKRALELNASALILVHNHPSGDPTPSQADITMTRTLADACGRLGIKVHDHIVVGTSGQVSFREQGLL